MSSGLLPLLDGLDEFDLNLDSYFEDAGYRSLVNGMLAGRLRGLAGYLRQFKMTDLLEVVLGLDVE